MTIERIGVIGAGQMGNGIAHVLALAGYDVVLDDINKDTLAKALERIDKNMHRQAARGLIKDDHDRAGAEAHPHHPGARRHEGPRPGDRGGDRGRSDQEEDLPGAVAAPERQGDDRDQHLVDLGDAAGRRRPTGRSVSSACIS